MWRTLSTQWGWYMHWGQEAKATHRLKKPADCGLASAAGDPPGTLQGAEIRPGHFCQVSQLWDPPRKRRARNTQSGVRCSRGMWAGSKASCHRKDVLFHWLWGHCFFTPPLNPLAISAHPRLSPSSQTITDLAPVKPPAVSCSLTFEVKTMEGAERFDVGRDFCILL